MYVTVYQRGNGFTYCVDGEFAPRTYPTENAAKLAAFDKWWEMQELFANSPYNRKGYEEPAHASWGAFFAELGWNPEYKPSGGTGWNPTFRIRGDDGDCLVRVELQYQISSLCSKIPGGVQQAEAVSNYWQPMPILRISTERQ